MTKQRTVGTTDAEIDVLARVLAATIGPEVSDAAAVPEPPRINTVMAGNRRVNLVEQYGSPRQIKVLLLHAAARPLLNLLLGSLNERRSADRVPIVLTIKAGPARRTQVVLAPALVQGSNDCWQAVQRGATMFVLGRFPSIPIS